jgi:hypothetical protein
MTAPEPGNWSLTFAESGLTSEDEFYKVKFHDEPHDPTATFLSVLTAPYIPPPPPTPVHLGPDVVHPNVARRSFEMVDWSPPTPQTEDEEDSSDDEENTPHKPDFRKMTEMEIEEATIVPSAEDFERKIYAPHEKWAWTEGSAIDEPEVLMFLGST